MPVNLSRACDGAATDVAAQRRADDGMGVITRKIAISPFNDPTALFLLMVH